MLQSQTQTCLSFEAERGGKGGSAEGANFKPKAISFFNFFFFFFYELTLADVWLYHSQSNSQHRVQLCRASLAPPHPHKARLCTRLHLGEGCREFLGGVLGKLLLCLGIPESAQFVLRGLEGQPIQPALPKDESACIAQSLLTFPEQKEPQLPVGF